MGERSSFFDRDRRHAPPPGPRRVGSSLVAAARELGAEGALGVAALSRRWAEIAGQTVADHSAPVSLRDGTLNVAADHNAWAAQLRLLSGDLLRKVQVVAPEVAAISVHVSPSGKPGLVK